MKKRKTIFFYIKRLFRTFCKKKNQVDPNLISENKVKDSKKNVSPVKPQQIKTFKQLNINEECEGFSLFIFGPDLYLRKFIRNVVSCREFEFVILFFIILSSIQLCLENPLSNP